MCSGRYIPHIILRTAFVAHAAKGRMSKKKVKSMGEPRTADMRERISEQAIREGGIQGESGDERLTAASRYGSSWDGVKLCTLQLRARESPDKYAGERGIRWSEAVQTSVIKLPGPNQLPNPG